MARIHPESSLIIGANGQLGNALRHEFIGADFTDRTTFDVTDPDAWSSRNWADYDTVINAAAYTAVDAAETPEGALDAFKVNALALTHLARTALQHDLTVVHVSSDYVFDGTHKVHTEDEPFTPLNIYGASKATGDAIISGLPQHYLLRTTWVVGEGNNFVKTMKSLAERGVKPNVVNDQIGRLTFTEDLSKAIRHLIDTSAPYGTYNVTNEGESVSWDTIAKRTYELSGHNPDDVTGVSTEQYFAAQKEAGKAIAERPLQSTMDLTKIKAAGFTPRQWDEALAQYIEQL